MLHPAGYILFRHKEPECISGQKKMEQKKEKWWGGGSNYLGDVAFSLELSHSKIYLRYSIARLNPKK
jgi:hypothetical protein